nr:NADH dehydrogenase subunit 1 [Amynthas sp. HU201607-04]QED22671.1 NADH dehydrogenase subunit 1 [Amynthas sp. JX201401-05]QED22672.1 NADH dehydrogenase subunit 1 [Amynthas sp. ZJ201509-01]QED22673.1 NADH dehydrogenase subunit 1 [Amynthas sp. ZJ201505-04]QED22674.1 NADH dehydrogenase subunit 1 [Amynthas sp. ZJ201504-02]QED22675.1 NADH dehydrogenase subunit 1 [Amynthas sp. HK201601-20]QED22676.1 NADH dehydrogenase subunit 1 [Amynthas sp. GZ201605-04]QED22677.1 NADH dehydrogenase subunit 1 [A
MRGKVARTQTNSIAMNMVFTSSSMSDMNMFGILMNTMLVNSLIAKMFMYSAMKIIANSPLLYSTLKPDTSSDSPSAKSNGVRFVSAKFVMNQVTVTGISIISIHEYIVILVKSIVMTSMSALSKISDILTSYEIVCATPRSAPSSAYFEFDLHPAMNVEYTFMLETHKKYSTLNCKK